MILKIESLPDDLTPDKISPSLFERPYFFLLESSLAGGEEGRYSIAAFDPVVVHKLPQSTELPSLTEPWIPPDPPGFTKHVASDLPFAGGWIGYLSYECGVSQEKKVPARQPDLLPWRVFCFYDRFYLYDHRNKKAHFVSLSISSDPATSDIGEITRISKDSLKPSGLQKKEAPSSEMTKEDSIAAIRKIKNYIEAGDCYQVNLSQRFSSKTSESPYRIYQKLRRISPAPYASFLNLGDAQVISSSPESFLKIDGDDIFTQPIKGTRRRGRTNAEDQELREELWHSSKDRAELLMITDLERNDLGKIGVPGSVQVPHIGRIESYAQVHHLVSKISGKILPDKNINDVLKAVFPGGSITGAPKVRAMQIIRDLETVPRNIYCGAIGYVSLNGKAQFNIAIRTMVMRDGQVHFWSGGGIVADSDPEAEWQEILVKSRGMIEALKE